MAPHGGRRDVVKRYSIRGRSLGASWAIPCNAKAAPGSADVAAMTCVAAPAAAEGVL
jgi:hypothetical protein